MLGSVCNVYTEETEKLFDFSEGTFPSSKYLVTVFQSLERCITRNKFHNLDFDWLVL